MIRSGVLQISTINDIVFRILQNDLPAAMRVRRRDGTWEEFSSSEIYRRVVNTARALEGWGICKGDRIGLISENRPEWAITDFATLMIGAVDVPLYPTLTVEQSAYILKDAGVKTIFVSSREQLAKIQSIKEQVGLERIVVMDDVEDSTTTKMQDIMASAPFARDERLDQLSKSIAPADLAMVIYTSGTTGTPKGVMLTHGNLASNIVGSTSVYQWSTGEGYISFLPLSHITARHIDYLMLGKGVSVSYCPRFEELPRTMLEVRPHNFVSVPRVYEKIRQEAERKAGAGLKKKIFKWAMNVGRRHRDEVVAGNTPSSLAWRIANALVFSKIRAAMGGRVTCLISGGAPLGIETSQWFADVGICIHEGYGLTETSPVIAVNTREHNRLGTVGPPLKNIECKIAPDGELLVRGPSVMQGYWNLPTETVLAFQDGWFCTGDIATIDADGFLKITDRKKDLIKTSGGKFIAPQPIENSLKANVLVSFAVVVGDRRKFPAVLIAPNFPLLEDWAKANAVTFSGRSQLIADERVRALYEDIVTELNCNLAKFERLKRVALVPDEFTITSGELTPSLKLKRRVVEQKYVKLIESIYTEATLEAQTTP